MKVILLSLFVGLMMVGCGESSNPSESAEMNHTAPKKDATETAVDIVDGRKLEKRNGVAYLPNEETPFTGRAVGFFENGQKRYEENYKNGKKHGFATKWYENGQKMSEENYKDGKEDGLSSFWYKNGQKNAEGNYKDGKLMSAEVWKPNGEKCPVTNVKDGNGVVVEYKEDGTERFRLTFKDGIKVPDSRFKEKFPVASPI